MVRRLERLCRRARALVPCVLPGLLLLACDEKGEGPPTSTTSDASTTSQTDGATSTVDVDYDTDYSIPESPAPAVRRLSGREVEKTYLAVVGMAPSALAQVPPDPRDYTFDRVVNAQTVSSIHAEAYDAAAHEAADWLVAERRLDDFAAACTDAIMPPAAPSTTSVTGAFGMVVEPDWALLPDPNDPERQLIRYAPECSASLAAPIAVDGTYRITLDVEFDQMFTTVLSIDGAEAETWSNEGQQLLVHEGALTAGSHLFAFDFQQTGPANPYVYLRSLTIEGPIDQNTSATAERAACVTGLIDSLGSQAFRRPLLGAETARLETLLSDAIGDGGSWGEAVRMVIRAILGSPKFLYLVEVGAATDDPHRFALNDYEIAQRLSYAICEMPPDATLRTAAAAGELKTGEQIRVQAERLFGLPCAEESVARFYRQWLWLERLPSTAKDPTVYPEFSAAISQAMAEEADDYLRTITFDEHADIVALYGKAFTSPGLDATPREGVLMLPGVLTVTSKFAQTSPVIRGVYVLEQILCQELPSPPVTVDTTPPALDPTMTSRERWAMHSNAPSCKECHAQIDPIGFTFEEYDAMGRHRTTENGLPVDPSGEVPALQATDVQGVADLAELVASSDLATQCLARQWLRFAVGRLEETPDALAIAEVAAALRGENGSLVKGFIALTASPSFRERVERAPTEDGEGETP